MRTPDYYPVAFHQAIMSGGAVLFAENLPWTLKSSRNRFYGFLGSLRATPGHPLHLLAYRPWSVENNGQALVIRPTEANGKTRQLGDTAPKVLKTLLDKGAGRV